MLNARFEGYTLSLTSRLDVPTTTFLDAIYEKTDGVHYDVFINNVQVARSVPGVERVLLGDIMSIASWLCDSCRHMVVVVANLDTMCSGGMQMGVNKMDIFPWGTSFLYILICFLYAFYDMLI